MRRALVFAALLLVIVARPVYRWRRASDWPVDKRLWKAAHGWIGNLAWKYARPDGPEWGIGLRIDRSQPLWRLNDWAASHWTDWWIARTISRPVPECPDLSELSYGDMPSWPSPGSSRLVFTFPDGTTGPGNWNPDTGQVEPVR